MAAPSAPEAKALLVRLTAIIFFTTAVSGIVFQSTTFALPKVFDEAWYEGEAVDTVEFVERNGKTTLTTTILYVSKEARDGVLKSPMDQGMAASFDKLAALLAKSA